MTTFCFISMTAVFRRHFVGKTSRNFCYCDTAYTLCRRVSDHVDIFLNEIDSDYHRLTRQIFAPQFHALWHVIYTKWRRGDSDTYDVVGELVLEFTSVGHDGRLSLLSLAQRTTTVLEHSTASTCRHSTTHCNTLLRCDDTTTDWH